eukprot:jgi/Antlo1/1845/1346
MSSKSTFGLEALSHPLLDAERPYAMGVTCTIYDVEKRLEDELARDSTLVPIYLNVTKETGVTKLSLSEGRGERLYCVSNCKHRCLLEHFGIPSEKVVCRRETEEVPSIQGSAKRAKQGNLLNFANNK